MLSGVAREDDCDAGDWAGVADAEDMRLRVTGCCPVCLPLVTLTTVTSASVLIDALQVLPKQRQDMSPFLNSLKCLYL